MAKTKSYDMIFMDIHMPEMDGIEATEIIRKFEDPVKREVPIIALTAYSMPEDSFAFRKAGINDYMSKPIKREQILSLVERYALVR